MKEFESGIRGHAHKTLAAEAVGAGREAPRAKCVGFDWEKEQTLSSFFG